MDNEHPSNNLNQANSFELIEVIEEIIVDTDILENFLQEEYDEDAYVDEVYVDNDDLIIDQEFNLSQEIESQDQEYNTSYEMESPTDDQSLPNIDNSISLLDSDDEDTSNKQLEPTVAMVDEEALSSINYIQTPPNRSMFPGYNKTVFNELKNIVSNKRPKELLDPSRSYGSSTFNDLLRLFVPTLWLNDIIIDQYFKLLIQNCNSNDIVNLGTFLFKDVPKSRFDKSVELFLKRKKILNYNIIMAPLHLDDNHWALLIGNINKKKIYVYDSFSIPYESLNEKLKLFVSFLNKEYLEKKLDLRSLNNFTWDITMKLSPLQDNSSDCGVFMCTNARYHLFDVPINYNQEDIPLIRQRMSYELTHNTLLSTH